jgi:gluconate 2-dehydrogenase subunit 3-like protein
MTDRYPGYDVLSKRNSPSWNEQTRKVIDQRLAIDPDQHRFFNDLEWQTLNALCTRIIPQPGDRARPAPLAAMIDQKMLGGGDGYRDARLPPGKDAWRQGLAALEAEAKARFAVSFAALAAKQQDALLRDVQNGQIKTNRWAGLTPELFFAKLVLHDIVTAYYANPVAWNEIGFGGPASPRGYVRMDFDRRDPWEASEAKPGHEDTARRENERVG